MKEFIVRNAKSYWPYYVAVAVILLPLLQSGYILTLDMIFTDRMPIPESTNPSYIFYAVISLLGSILGSDLIQKVLLVTALLCMSIGMHNLAKQLLPLSKPSWIYVIAGMLYAFNPFVYSRFMAGQYAVLLGYALMPLFISSLMRFLQRPTWQHTISVTAWLALTSIVSIHTLGLLAILGIPIIALHAYRRKEHYEWYRLILGRFTVMIGAVLLASCYWLLPTLLGRGAIKEVVSSFDSSDFNAFTTQGDGLGVIGNILAMQGFWADAKNLYLMPQDKYSWWLIPIILLWLLVATGVYRGWKIKRGITISLLLSLCTAIALSAGSVETIFAPMNQWLLANVPFFSGYREPQKFVGIIVFCYALFTALGVDQIAEWLKDHTVTKASVNHICILILLIPLACAPLMAWGFAGQLKTSHYPNEWYSMNSFINQTALKDQEVLALPWHLYMRFDFAGRVIANPMDTFFDAPLITSSDPELQGARSYSNTAVQKVLNDQILPSAAERTDLSQRLAALGIDYILLAKEFDYKDYRYLDSQAGIKLIRENNNLKLYAIDPGMIDR